MTAAEPNDPERRGSPGHVRAGLALFFFLAQHASGSLRLLRPIAVPLTLLASPSVRENLKRNAEGIYGRSLTPALHRAHARGVVGNFYDFVVDLGKSGRASHEAILERVESIEGEPAYLEARKSRRGAVLVTAHMGAFEVGLAALRRVEPNVHVVFKRDAFGSFEQVRSRVRRRLGVTEEPIDDGFNALVRLRDALEADHVVVMQGDRSMPGQRAMAMPFLSGKLRMPIGPVKLARLTGSPIVPVFVLRTPRGRFTIHLGAPIVLEALPDASLETVMKMLATAMQDFVRRAPTQWLVLERAFSEDCGPDVR